MHKIKEGEKNKQTGNLDESAMVGQELEIQRKKESEKMKLVQEEARNMTFTSAMKDFIYTLFFNKNGDFFHRGSTFLYFSRNKPQTFLVNS